MKNRVLAVLILFLVSQASFAVITFDQLTDDIFVVSHRIKLAGSRGRAMKLVYEKSASLCAAAGFTHYAILDQESAAGQRYEAANASIRIQLFQVTGEGRIDCEKNANPDYVAQAHAKLARRGYVPPDPATVAAAEAAAAEASSACTVEQITAMVRAGLSDEQIRAACPEDG